MEKKIKKSKIKFILKKPATPQPPKPTPPQSPKAPTPKSPAPTKTPPKPAPRKSFTIENKFLLDSILYLKQKEILKERKVIINFDSVKEAEDSMEEDILAAINDKLNNVKQDISFVQKKGKSLVIEGIKLLEVPLKKRVWLSTYKRKDLELIVNLIEKVQQKVAPLKKEAELKEIEKEKRNL